MPAPPFHVVTGAFGYTGQAIAEQLLATGRRVLTLTNSIPATNPFGDAIRVAPLSFNDPARLTDALCGAAVLYNTYWVRGNQRGTTLNKAIENSLTLVAAARTAGVRRVVHISITNPTEDSPLEYFRGKARVERAWRESGLSVAILRPAALFGRADVLINNLAWALRRLPVIGVFGNGRYRLQPIHVRDLAELAVAQGARDADVTLNAIGPETFTYRELLANIGRAIGKQRPMVPVPAALGFAFSRMVGAWLGDELVSWEEIRALQANLLWVDTPPTGTTRLTDWLQTHSATLGRVYRRSRRPAR